MQNKTYTFVRQTLAYGEPRFVFNTSFANKTIGNLFAEGIRVKDPDGLSQEIERTSWRIFNLIERDKEEFEWQPFVGKMRLLSELVDVEATLAPLDIDKDLILQQFHTFLGLVALGHLDTLLDLWVEDRVAKHVLTKEEAREGLSLVYSETYLSWIYGALITAQSGGEDDPHLIGMTTDILDEYLAVLKAPGGRRKTDLFKEFVRRLRNRISRTRYLVETYYYERSYR